MEEIADVYDIRFLLAKNVVMRSHMQDCLRDTDVEYICHIPIDYWAALVYDEMLDDGVTNL